MPYLQPVVWSKGTLLHPQHLQTHDRFLESMLQFRHDSLSLYPWGFLNLELDRTSLDAGTLALKSAAGLFPDGLAFAVPEADPAPLARSLAEYPIPPGEWLDVWLAVPAERPQELNVATGQTRNDTRYVADVIEVKDEVGGGAPKPVAVARKSLRLLMGDEHRQGFSTLRMGAVRKTPAGQFEWNDQLVPPLLNLGASPALKAMGRGILELMTARAAELAGGRRQRNAALADFTSGEVAGFWLLYTINSFLPEVRHFVEVRYGHPEPFYRLLLSLTGALTAFSSEITPASLPAYRHEDPGPCFREVETALRKLLETVIPRDFLAIRLEEARPLIRSASLVEDRIFTGLRYFLAISSDTRMGDIIARAPSQLKIASLAQVDHLVRHALPGVELRHVSRPGGSLPYRTGCEYFQLNPAGPAWESVVRARDIAVYAPDEFSQASFELIVLLRPS
jgi:type VI secretion system protein ImpJ